MLVANAGGEKLERVGQVVAFVGYDVHRGGPSVESLCGENFAEQFLFDRVLALLGPERFATEAIVLGIVLIQAGNPLVDCGDDGILGPIAKFAAGAIAGAWLVLTQLIEQFPLRLVILRYRLN